MILLQTRGKTGECSYRIRLFGSIVTEECTRLVSLKITCNSLKISCSNLNISHSSPKVVAVP